MAAPTLLQTIARSATAGITPFNSAQAHDVFKVAGGGKSLFSPPCKIVECSGIESIAQEQQAPGMTGAILVIRGSHLVSVTYEVQTWNDVIEAQYAALIAMLRAAQKARPQQSLTLTDLRLRDLGPLSMTPVLIPGREQKAVGLHGFKFKFMQNKRLQLAGGPVAPPRNATEVAILKKQDDIKAHQQQLADKQTAAALAAKKL